ncbi:uncharacterized protein LOC142334217 [Lycorma delicatula]|uniref:uncharacterized protein LOC142334217 n=1 Tax=Lycorma delicatula TaxID=130591 RepID=UPI003F5177B3
MDFLNYVFAAVTVALNFVIPVSAKYCTFDADGELRYYICPRHEYCCNFRCCSSPTFQFYQLWYYWLMVIFMFLLCSGGGWWYRYWFQDRYGPELGTSMPTPSSRFHTHHLSHRPARISYNPSRDAVVLHHIWKPCGLGSTFHHASPPPSYACAQRATRVSLPHQSPQASPGMSNIVSAVNPKISPYYQLYGPPPPYEAVVSTQQETHQSTEASTQSCNLILQSQLQQHADNVLVSSSSNNEAAAPTITSASSDSATTRAQQSSQESSNINAV